MNGKIVVEAKGLAGAIGRSCCATAHRKVIDAGILGDHHRVRRLKPDPGARRRGRRPGVRTLLIRVGARGRGNGPGCGRGLGTAVVLGGTGAGGRSLRCDCFGGTDRIGEACRPDCRAILSFLPCRLSVPGERNDSEPHARRPVERYPAVCDDKCPPCTDIEGGSGIRGVC